MEQPVKFENTHLPDIIDLKGVKQVYNDKPPIIKDFNLLIEDKPNQGQFVVLLGPSGCGKCVAKGTWITASTGLRRIEDLFEDYEYDDDKLIKANDLSVLVNSAKENISHKYYGGYKKTIKLTAENGDYIEGTSIHPVLVCNKNGKMIWKKMSNIKMGDLLVKEAFQPLFETQTNRVSLPRAIPKSYTAKINKISKYKSMGLNQREISKLTDFSPTVVNRIVNGKYRKCKFKAPQHMSENLAYYFGLLAGDGSISKQIGFTSADKQLIDFFCNYTKKTFGITSTISKKTETKAVLIRPKESDLYRDWLHKIFDGPVNSTTKDVPSVVRKASFKHQMAFMRGLFDTDGYSDVKNKRAEIALNSKQLIDFVCCMLSALGVKYTRSFKGKSHRVSIRQSDSLKHLFNLQRKLQSNNKTKPPIFERETYKVTNIEDGWSEVYDLTNPTSESFVANSFVVHNSTILRYISGLQDPTEGEVLIRGKKRTNEDRVGMVFQQYSSFPWYSVLDNVALGLEYQGVPKKERREKAMDIIRKVGLEGHEDKYAQYPTLSGGQLQRVAIARSLAYLSDDESQILLMDEPFGALDVETRLQMQDLLADIWTDIHPTVVFVTHDIPEAVYLGDDIYVLGRNPGNIRKKFVSPLPFARDKSMKRQSNFIHQVNEIEDYMINIGAK